jgi:5-methylcytosine-specific restriction endonuclease McrA
MKKTRLHSSLVLKLNGCWQAIGYTSPKEAFQRMFQQGQGSVKALDIILEENGSISSETQVYDAQDWMELPVREGDPYIGLAHGKKVRVPLVTIVPHYKTLPKVRLTFNKRGLYTRDRGICSYCLKVLEYDDATNDHIIPTSKGGKTDWENCTLACQKCNNEKGDMTPQEAGMFPRRKPKTPGLIPIMPELRHNAPMEHRALLLHAA